MKVDSETAITLGCAVGLGTAIFFAIPLEFWVKMIALCIGFFALIIVPISMRKIRKLRQIRITFKKVCKAFWSEAIVIIVLSLVPLILYFIEGRT